MLESVVMPFFTVHPMRTSLSVTGKLSIVARAVQTSLLVFTAAQQIKILAVVHVGALHVRWNASMAIRKLALDVRPLMVLLKQRAVLPFALLRSTQGRMISMAAQKYTATKSSNRENPGFSRVLPNSHFAHFLYILRLSLLQFSPCCQLYLGGRQVLAEGHEGRP